MTGQAVDRPTLALAELDAYDAHPAGGGSERRYCCPLEGCRGKPIDRQHQSLCVNVDSGAWLCNRCGATGKLTDRWDHRPRHQRGRATALHRFALPPQRPQGTAETAPLVPALLARCRPVAGSPGADYLFSRGLSADVATAADVRFCGDVYGRAAVVFPIRDRAERIVAVNVRYLTVKGDQTKTRCVGDRKLGVFATPGAWDAAAPLVVVEGPCDALALAECGVSAVALVCTRAPHWLGQAAAFRRVYVALDADAEGDEKSGLLADELAPFARTVERLRPPMGKDWNDALLADYASLCDFLGERIGR